MKKTTPLETRIAEAQSENTNLTITPETDVTTGVVMFPTANLVLNREQEMRMVEWSNERHRQTAQELGRDKTENSDWMTGVHGAEKLRLASDTFFGQREIYGMIYDQNMEWRKYRHGGLFLDSNLHVPLTKRVLQQQIARANKFFFATDPWCAITPVGTDDKEFAQQANRWVNHKLRRGRVKAALRKAVELAFIRGEAVVKDSWADRRTYYKTLETVLVDEAGQPVIAADGDYITQQDQVTIINMDAEGNPLAPEEMELVAQQAIVLKRDGVTQVPPPEQAVYQELLVDRELRNENNPDASVVYFKDFLCPLTAPDVQTADFIAHDYDLPTIEIIQQYLASFDEFESGAERSQVIDNVMKLINSQESGELSFANRADQLDGSENEDMGGGREQQGNNEMTCVSERHITFDPYGDGKLCDITLIVNRDNGTPIFYDYTANVTPKGRRPFTVIRCEEVDGRWFGRSSVKILENVQEMMDLFINRMNRQLSSANRITVVNPGAVVEGDENPNLILDPDKQYTFKQDRTMDDFIQIKYLEERESDKLMGMVEFGQQWGMNMSGVANGNDTRAAGLDTTKLATGIRNVEMSGQELFAEFLHDLTVGVESATERQMLRVLDNADENETYEYFEGKSVLKENIDTTRLRGLSLNIRLEMSRYHGEQVLANSKMIIETLTSYYTGLPYNVQIVTQGAFVNILNALEVQDSESLIVPQEIPMLPPEGGGGSPDIDPQQAPTGKEVQVEPNF